MMFGGMFLVWIVLIGGIFWFVKYMTDQNRSQKSMHESKKDAMEILRERYARGEINKEEFDEHKKDIIS
ncbi:hypothetical protein BMS3Abin05_00020 [bacterium BMS3Abin05]|nr:hypothetical protein BMS3Abin05_00020 [bacterium BMS3Abin05]GBE27861.1 hypothetical protein BMS3Bbin03_01791 [bacterium BMS3Bbin03]HDZ13231.1 SHOCT domain-containing protein [Bacteroidota bacterium]